MFFGGNNGVLGAPMEQQGVNQLQGYERRLNPGQGQVVSSNPSSYGQPGFQLTPGTNPFNPGQQPPAGMGVPAGGLPTGAGGMPVPAGANPPFNPGASGVPSAAAPTPDTGDVATDIQIAAGQNPMGYQFKEPMTTGQRLSALGMVLSAAGTPDFARVAGTVQAGITQRTQGIDKYNRDLRAMTTEQTELVVEDGLYKNKHTPASYKISADGKGIEFIGNATPYFTEIEGGDFREPKDPTKREIKAGADGYQRYVDTGEMVYPDQYEDGVDISAEGVMSAQRFLRQEIDKDITPIENEILQIDLAAQTAAAVYMDSGSTKEEKTEADRSLVKLVEKLWDPTSAVLGGEFESAQAAQSWYDTKMREFDLTSGETLGPDKRKALLGVLQRVGTQKANTFNNRARDLTSRAGSTFGRYKDSQVAGAIEGSLPEAWRTAPDGTVGGAGDYYDRGLSPAWEAMMQSPWWMGKSTPKDGNQGGETTPSLEEQAAGITAQQAEKIFMPGGRAL